jgi:hypothetical protein
VVQAERDDKGKMAKKLAKAAEAAAKKRTDLEREQATVAEKEKHLQARVLLTEAVNYLD